MLSKLNFFSQRQHQNEVFGADYITVRSIPISKGPTNFQIKESKEYFDLSETVLKLTLKVTKADGSAITAGSEGKDDMALVNNAIHSIFSDVQVSIDQKIVDG